MDQHINSTDEEDVECSQPIMKKCTKRGPTKLSLSGARSKGRRKKIKIELNEKGQPCGPTRPLSSSDYGRLCRSYIPINTRNVSKLDKSVKSKILVDIEENFYCEKTLNWQETMLMRVTNRLRAWKNAMYTKFILPNLNSLHKIAKPPPKYTTITAEQWTDFVMERTSPDWEVIRKKAQDKQRNNKYPHRMSRKGYAGLEEELQAKRGSFDSIPRHELWKEGRCKDGEYLNDSVREQADKIDEVARRVQEGTLEVNGSNDVLTQALGTSEHCGCVRGLGKGVNPSVYFKAPRRTSAHTDDRFLEMQQCMRILATELQRIGGNVPEFVTAHLNLSEIISSNSDKYTSSIPDLRSLETECLSRGPSSPMVEVERRSPDQQLQNDENSCLLALGSIDCIVARGRMHDGQILHGVLMGEGNARVSVVGLEKPGYSSLHLPIPTQDATTLGAALGSFVSWPKTHIIMNTTLVHSPHKKRAQEQKLAITAFQAFVHNATKDFKNKALTIGIHGGVFRNIDPSYIPLTETHVVLSDLMDIIEFKKIENSMLRVYMGALYMNLMERGLEDRFAFAPPSGVAGYPSEVNSMDLYDCLVTSKPYMNFFYPFNIGLHWILCVIDPWKRHAFYFDPLGNRMVSSIKEVLENAFKQLNYNHKFRSTIALPTFKEVMCPKQPGNKECGYYVLRYMKDIVESRSVIDCHKFDSIESYTIEEIDDVRVEIMNYISKHMKSK